MFFLGQFVQDGVVLEGYAYARYATPAEFGRRENAKPPWAGGGKGGGAGEEADPATCYSYIAKGAKWNTVEGYLFDLTNTNIGSVTKSGIDGAFGAWEAAAGKDIVGFGEPVPDGYELVADTSGTDGQNEIYFASISDPGVLGYTIVWSTRSRGRRAGQIVESDMVIDDDNWSWYTGANGAGMDFWGVFAHEAGHWVGMGHTETTDLCIEQTMYPSIGAGDSSKRTLEEGDTTGVSALY